MPTYLEDLAAYQDLSPEQQQQTDTPVYGSQHMATVGREMALGGVPLQVGSLLSAIAQLRARAAGSPGEILPAVLGQLGQMRTQYAQASQAINRRLGYGGGGQVQREQANLLGQAGQQYGRLFTAEQLTATANLLNTLTAFQPGVSGAARPPQVRSADTPFNAAPYGAGIASIVDTARTIADYYQQPAALTFAPPTAIAPTTSPAYGPELYP